MDRSPSSPDHSPFTAALLAVLPRQLALKDLNGELVDAVVADTGRQQRPFVGGSYGKEAGNLVLG